MSLRKTRVVLDTNVLVSGILFENGKEARILRLAANGEIDVFASVDILAAFVRVISRQKFQLTTLEVNWPASTFRITVALGSFTVASIAGPTALKFVLSRQPRFCMLRD